jgi:hypothetical protein
MRPQDGAPSRQSPVPGHLDAETRLADDMLARRVTAVQSYLAVGDLADACSTLSAFVHQVSAQSDKSIPPGQAAALIATAQRIKAVLAC